MGALDYVGFNQVSHYAPLGAPTACDGDIWSNAYQMQQLIWKKLAVIAGLVPYLKLFAAF